MDCRLLCLTALASFSACTMQPQAAADLQPNIPVPPAAWAQAEHQADRFDRAFHAGGMSAVATDIDRCYATAMRSGEQVPVRNCLVYDDFADRFADQMNRQANLPIPIFFQPGTAYQRLARYSGPAGFDDAQFMAGYLRQGSNTIFSVIASRSKSSN